MVYLKVLFRRKIQYFSNSEFCCLCIGSITDARKVWMRERIICGQSTFYLFVSLLPGFVFCTSGLRGVNEIYPESGNPLNVSKSD